MSAVCLIDTSVFVQILNMPGMNQDHANILDELKFRIEDGEALFLPMATLIESGNHIGQVGDGTLRRQTAERFVDQVGKALRNESPFKPIDFLEASKMQRWLDEFTEWATHGSGLGDLSIKHDWDRLCDQNRAQRVYIWSLDGHLSSFDRGPVV